MAKGMKRSATWADVASARKRGMKEMLEIVTYALSSKQGFEKDDIKYLMENISYTLDSISDGRITMKDIQETIKDEIKVAFTTRE